MFFYVNPMKRYITYIDDPGACAGGWVWLSQIDRAIPRVRMRPNQRSFRMASSETEVETYCALA